MSDTLNFVDILKPRNTKFGIVKFMTRSWDPKKTLTLDKYYMPQDLKKIVADSVYIDAIIEKESKKNGTSKEKLRKEVLDYLEEIAMDKKLHVIRWMGIVFLKICFMMKIGVFVNEPAVLKLKSTLGKNPVLFLPTHRSYADFCLMTYLCFHYDIDLPAVAAGMDFYSMAVIGQGMRETGAFYMRRSLAGAPLYAATLRRYARALVALGAAPVEFFLEGTRSRTNKSLPPKYGMLSMTLMPYFAREVADITVVPVNISYDRLMEQELFAYELLGVPKPKESTGSFLKSLHRLNDHFGNIYINLGEPVSMREFAGVQPLSSEMSKPLDLQQLTPEQFKTVQNFGDYMVARQQACTVVTISNLLSIVLMESLVKNELLNLEQVTEKIEWLIKVLRDLGASVFENDVRSSVERILVVHRKLMRLDHRNRLRLVSGAPMNITAEVQKKMKGHILKAETMATAVPVIQLQLYVNPVLHFLVPPAIISVLVERGVNNEEELSADYHRLRTMLRYEFFHLENAEEAQFSSALQYCVRSAAVTSSLSRGDNVALRTLLRVALAPALRTLLLCAQVMEQSGACAPAQAGRRAQRRAERERRHPACLALAGAGAALRGLARAAALARAASKNEEIYEPVEGKLEECRRLVESVLPDFDVDFSYNNSVILNQDDIKSKL